MTFPATINKPFQHGPLCGFSSRIGYLLISAREIFAVETKIKRDDAVDLINKPGREYLLLFMKTKSFTTVDGVQNAIFPSPSFTGRMPFRACAYVMQ